MEDKIIRYLNGNELLQKNIPLLQEIFVNYYGEEYRERITHMISHTLWIGFQSPNGIKRQLKILEDKKTEELGLKILESTHSSLNIQDLFDGNSFEFIRNHPLEKYRLLRENFILGIDGRKEELIKEGFERIYKYDKSLTIEKFRKIFETKIIPEKYQKNSIVLEFIKDCIDEEKIKTRYEDTYKRVEPLLKKIDHEITVENFDERLKNSQFDIMNLLLIKYQEAKQEYLRYKENFQIYYNQLAEFEKKQQELKHHYYNLLVLENIELIPKNKQQEVIDYIKNKSDKKRNYRLEAMMESLFGSSIYRTGGIDAFSEGNEQERISNDWKKEIIEKKRVNFFKAYGIDLGDSYESYEKNEEASERIPSPMAITKLEETRKKLIQEFNHMIYSTLSTHQELRRRVEDRNLLDKDDSIDERLYLLGQTFISPNITNRNGRAELSPLLIINFDNIYENSLDHNIIHEINHLIELSLLDYNETIYTTSCGWEIITSNLGSKKDFDQSKKRELRDYELMNEIINEKIAQEISSQMHEEKIFIFDDPEKSKYKNQTSYEYYNFLIEDFYHEFKKEILESRIDGRINIIWETVGKENFDALNNLIKEFAKKVDGYKMVSLIISLENKEDTELTKFYKKAVEEKEKILEQMREYKKENMIH